MPNVPYFDLVLGLAALVEGLALAKIADVGVDALLKPTEVGSFAIVKLVLCFVVVVRLYQGFISISIKPIEERDLHFQMIIVFILGITQTIMIAAVGRSNGSDIYYACALLISFLGSSLHWRNQFSLFHKKKKYKLKSYDYEADFQFFSFVILALASVFIVIARLAVGTFIEVIAIVVPIVLLFLNGCLSYELFIYNAEDGKTRRLPASGRAMERLREAMARVGVRRPADIWARPRPSDDLP